MRSSTIIAAVLLIAAATLSAQGWGPDVRLTYDPAVSRTRSSSTWSVAVSGETIHAVWWDSRNGNYEVYYKRSTDNGTTWEADTRLTDDPGESVNTSIAVFGNNVHVVWRENCDGNAEIYYKRSTDGGTTWESDTRLTNTTNYSQCPSIAVSGKNVHVVWDEIHPGNHEIYYKRSTDNGLTWGPDTRLTDASGESTYPSVAVSGSNVHAIWQDHRDGNFEVYYKRSTDNGSSWGSDIRLTKNGTFSGCPSVAVSGNNVYATWQDNCDGNDEIYYRRSTDGGISWGTSTRLTNNPAASRWPSTAVSDNNIYVVWGDKRDGNWEMYYKRSTDNGATWDSDTRLTDNSGSSLGPSIAVSGTSLHVVWYDNRDGNWEVYYKRYFPYPNIAPLAAVTGTSLHPGGGRDVDKLNDESFSGFWESAYTTGQIGDVWMMYEWPRPYRLDASLFYCSPATPPHLNLPIIYNIEAWVNAEWQEIAYVVNTDSNKAIFGDDLQDVITTKLRINLIDVRDTDSWGKDVATLSEWQVFGDTVPLIIEATVDFDPDKLNFASKGKWVTSYIELEEGYSLEDIDESTVAITEIDGEELDPPLFREGPTGIGDHDEDGMEDLMVKFDRQELIDILEAMGYEDGDEVKLTVAGELTTGEAFEGSDVIEMLDKGMKEEPDEGGILSSGPLGGGSTIEYSLPEPSNVRVSVYDASGRKVAKLVEEYQDAGEHALTWDGCDDAGRALPSGIYFLNFEAGKFSRKARLVILR